MLIECAFFQMGTLVATGLMPSAPRPGDFVSLNNLTWLVRDILWIVQGQTKANISVEPTYPAGGLPQY